MAEEKQLSLNQTTEFGNIGLQLIDIFEKSKNSNVFGAFRNLGEKIPMCIKKLPPPARPLLQQITRLYLDVDYKIRIGLGDSSNVLMMFVIKGLKVYRNNQEVDKQELVEITQDLDEKFLTDLQEFTTTTRENFLELYEILLPIGGADAYKNLIREKEELESKVEECFETKMQISNELRREEGKLEYYNFKIDANLKNSEDRKSLKSLLEKELQDLKDQLPFLKNEISKTSNTIYDTTRTTILFGLLYDKQSTTARHNPAREAAQKNFADVNNRRKTLTSTLENWDNNNVAQISEIIQNKTSAEINIAQFKDKLKKAIIDHEKWEQKLEEKLREMENLYKKLASQNTAALEMIDDLAITMKEGIELLQKDFTKVIIDSKKLTNKRISYDLTQSVIAALEIILISDRYNESNMLKRLEKELASVGWKAIDNK